MHKYSGTLFKPQNSYPAPSSEVVPNADMSMLIQTQAELLMKHYNTTCLDVRQLKEALNVGESNIYDLLSQQKLPCLTIGKRKVVPIIVLATYLTAGYSEKSS